MSWTNNLREKDVDGHSSDYKSHKPPDLQHHGPNDSKLINKEDYNPSQEIREVKTLLMHDRFIKPKKDGIEPTQVLLGLSPTIQPMTELCISTACSSTPTETKTIKKEDEEFLLAVRCKTPKQGTMDVGTVVYARNVVDEAGVLRHRVTLEPSPSKFDPSSKQHPPRFPLSVLRLGVQYIRALYGTFVHKVIILAVLSALTPRNIRIGVMDKSTSGPKLEDLPHRHQKVLIGLRI